MWFASNLFELLTQKVEAVPSGCHIIIYFQCLGWISVQNMCMMKTHRHVAIILHAGRWICNCGCLMLVRRPNCTVCKLSCVSSLKRVHSHCSHNQKCCKISGLQHCARDYHSRILAALLEPDREWWGCNLLVNNTQLHLNYFPSFELQVVVMQLWAPLYWFLSQSVNEMAVSFMVCWPDGKCQWHSFPRPSPKAWNCYEDGKRQTHLYDYLLTVWTQNTRTHFACNSIESLQIPIQATPPCF